ncbi:MAG: hypothetical protein J3Q66DRAFT_354615 [Benniella sp.]|nr:MAG: hypothetical protein J3Q66DRAFT_354615 [Benniella sp.]
MSYSAINADSRSNSPHPSGQQSRRSYGPISGDVQEPLDLDPFAATTNASPLTRHHQLEQVPSKDPFRPAAYETFGASTSSLRQQLYTNHISARPTPPHLSGLRPPFGAGMRSLQGTSAASSSVGSFDGRADNISSFQSSAHNLATGNDPLYSFMQSDSTIEVLSDRWNAYQAWWAKQYKEQPFYKIWTRSKWILLLSTLLLLGYSSAALAISLGYVLGHHENAVVVMEFHDNLVYITLAASIVGILSALVGLVGIFRDNRVWLSWYNLMLWPVFALYVSVGYIAFRRAKNHLRAHLKDEWIHSYTREQRLLVQRNLKCCGYQAPTYYGEYDLRCFPMTHLPGCQHKYNLYEDRLLTTCWNASFILVPFQLFVMIAALLCSNHVDGMLRSARPGLKSFKEK